MNADEAANLERDPRFPSCAWTGFFLQSWLPGRHTTNLNLVCSNGRLEGTGRDWVGAYTIDGEYDLATGRCEWTKQYIGKHSVAYRGVNDGHGIWGVWEIRQLGGLYVDRGGFHLWPEGTDVSEASAKTEQAVLEVMRKEFGQFGHPASRLTAVILVLGTIAGIVALGWKHRWWDF
jgi:hypothetical protein